MIIKKNKSYSFNSANTSGDFSDSNALFVIDEKLDENKSLIQKIVVNAPYYDFVLDEEGKLIDIIPTERPEPEPVIPEPSLEDYLLDLDFRMSMLELGL